MRPTHNVHSPHTLHSRFTVALAAAFMLTALAGDADARNWRQARRTTQRQRQATEQANGFKQFAQQNQMATATHRGKLFIKVDSSTLRQNFDAYARIGNGKVLEFSGKGHLHTRYNGKKDANFLFGLSGGTFNPPSGKRVTVVVKLSDSEHRELDAYVTAARANGNREIGRFSYNGGMPKRYYPNSSGKANCTSWISSAKLDGRQSLGRTCGVWDAASPTGWINSLARNGNSRVQAVLLHGFTGDVNNYRQIDKFITDNMKH